MNNKTQCISPANSIFLSKNMEFNYILLDREFNKESSDSREKYEQKNNLFFG